MIKKKYIYSYKSGRYIMKIEKTIIPAELNTYPLERIGKKEDVLFLDIETTGFTARTSDLYLIGCIYYENNVWNLIQWLAQDPGDEEMILKAFLALQQTRKVMIHYNGNNFDLPYLRQKCAQYELDFSYDEMDGIDIYKRIAPYKEMLKLENCKQKTVETYLDIHRDDRFNGGELISVYKDYCKSRNEYHYKALMQHNAEDMKGMFQILAVLTYSDLFLRPFKVVKVQANRYTSLQGEVEEEILMKLRFDAPFPKPFQLFSKGCRLSVDGTKGFLKVPLYRGELKYFYANYKEYYYLPLEDVALHKSVSSFVDKAHRVPATAATCYTRKESSYLPQWDIIFTPIFKKEYPSSDLFFELTPEIKKSPEDFRKYALHVIDMMAHDHKRKSRSNVIKAK